MTSAKTSKDKGKEGSRKKRAKREREITVVEVDDGRYGSMEEATQAMLEPLADALAAGIRSALAAGALIIVDGVVTLLPEEDDEMGMACNDTLTGSQPIRPASCAKGRPAAAVCA